jgi:hypothetical protein
MSEQISLDRLWDSPVASDSPVFELEKIAHFPAIVQRYFERAIAPGTALAARVRLRMHGEIKLNNHWYPLEAEQVIHADRGMIWQARTRMAAGVVIKGSDRLVDGAGAMLWRLFGLIPVMRASGADIARSGAGRMAAELVWLPSALCRQDVTWTAFDAKCAQAHFTLQGYAITLNLVLDDRGRLNAVYLKRWGDVGSGDFREADFGGIVEAETTLAGYTIPSRLRIGWFFGTPRFESEGEFFRVAIDEAVFC